MKQTVLSLALGSLLMTTACQASTSTSQTHSHDSNTEPNHSHDTTK